MNKMSWNAFRSAVIKATSTRRTIRCYGNQIALTASSNNTWLLTTCDDDPDYDLATVPGTSVGEVQPGTKFLGCDLRLTVYAPNSAGQHIVVALYRDPDNALGAIDPTTIWSSQAETQSTSMFRKNLFYVQRHTVPADHLVSTFVCHGTFAAKKRVRNLRENDRIMLAVLTGTGASQIMNIQGRIFTRY